jgi:hypothetical protein
MGPRALARWQWEGYANFHQSPRNLLIHVVAVPLFLLGNVIVLVGVLALSWWIALVGVLVSAGAFAAQGLGHKSEPFAPIPFSSFGNFVGRLFVEQWWTFPRFVLSGGWAHNLKAAP